MILIALAVILSSCNKEFIIDLDGEKVEVPAAKYKVKVTDLHTQRDGLKIYGKMYRPDGLEGKLPAVICCHGLMGHYTDCVPYAEEAAKRGFAAYCFDFCGGSMVSYSGGAYKDMSIFTEQKDLQAVIKLIKAQKDIDKENIFIAGASQGGLVTGMEAAEQKNAVKGIILLFPAFNIPGLFQEKLPEMYPDMSTVPDKVSIPGFTFFRAYWENIMDYDPYAVIGAYKGPVLIMHGTVDPLVPLSSSEKAAKIYENADLVVLKNQTHGFTGNGFNRSVNEILNFLFKHTE